MVEEDPGLQELVNDFVTESREHLAQVESDLLGMESGSAQGEGTIHRVFRAVHSVKGVAGFLGLETINQLSHTMESVLDLVRKDRLGMSNALATELLGANDLLRDLIDRVSESNTIPIDDQVRRLQAFHPGSGDAAGGAGPAVAPSAVAVELQPGEVLYELDLVVGRLALAVQRPITEVPEVVGRVGRVVSGATALVDACGSDRASSSPVRIQLVTDRSAAALQAQLHVEPGDVREVNRRGAPPAKAVEATPTPPRPASGEAAAEAAAEHAPKASVRTPAAASAEKPAGDKVGGDAHADSTGSRSCCSTS